MKTLLALLLTALPLLGGTATIGWDPNPVEQGIAGYKVYYGTQAGTYTEIVDVGDGTQVALILPADTYYLTVTAYNSAGLEGPMSEEFSFVMPPPLPTAPTGIRVIEIQTSNNMKDWSPVAWIPDIIDDPTKFTRAVRKEIEYAPNR